MRRTSPKAVTAVVTLVRQHDAFLHLKDYSRAIRLKINHQRNGTATSLVIRQTLEDDFPAMKSEEKGLSNHISKQVSDFHTKIVPGDARDRNINYEISLYAAKSTISLLWILER
jgi:hypothetical protein